MSDLSGSDGLPGLRLGQNKQNQRSDLPSQANPAVEKGQAFNAALTQSSTSSTAADAAQGGNQRALQADIATGRAEFSTGSASNPAGVQNATPSPAADVAQGGGQRAVQADIATGQADFSVGRGNGAASAERTTSSSVIDAGGGQGPSRADFTTGRSDSVAGQADFSAGRGDLATGRGDPASGRPDIATRPDVAVRADGAVRADINGRADAPGQQGQPGKGQAIVVPDAAALGRLGTGAIDIGKFNLPVLQLGAADKTVGLLQRALVVLGYETLRSDNIFGPKTDEATRSFQITRGLAADGIVGNRQTWPALNLALVSRHDGITNLIYAIAAENNAPIPQLAEQKVLNRLLAEFGEKIAPSMPQATSTQTAGLATLANGEMAYTVRAGDTLGDVARMFNLSLGALIAANPELAKPYLILQGQLLILPNPVRERGVRRPPHQLHEADPDGYLASPNMHAGFAAMINTMIEQLRGEGHDVRVLAGYRTFAEQQKYFDQGRTSPGKVRTDLEAGHSWHNYGLAVDMVLNDEDGNPAWPEESSTFWQRLGDIAIACGAVWGGTFGYPAHVEYHPAAGRKDAGSLIEEFESYGLEGVWKRVAPARMPAV